MHATYSPDDNKLRLYADGRLSSEDYERARGAGFRWAPKQELFVCPAWSPTAEDLLLEWCGDIRDEDASLVDRAEDRADRFAGYSDKRKADYHREANAVSKIADGIPLGQPILVGHHSERKARKDAERIEKGMRRAVRMWDTSEYWTARAAGVLSSAKYKQRPEVRARRIKKLEADRRRQVRRYTHDDTPPIVQRPIVGCWKEHGREATCIRCEPQPHVWCSDGRGGSWVPQRLLASIEAGCQRFIAHLDRRITYERALLGDQGGLDMLKPKPRRKQPPLLNYRGECGQVVTQNRYHRGETMTYGQIDMTKAEYARKSKDSKGTSLSLDGSHRVRTAMHRDDKGLTISAVYLTDSKDHGRPEG